jgi:hypothetical protein
MAAPAFVQASAGAVVTTGTATVSLTSCTAGNMVFLVWVEDGSLNESVTGNHVNTQNIAGGTSDLDFFQVIAMGSPTNSYLHCYVGRVTANGTISADLTVGAAGEDLFAVWYEFSGASTATTLTYPNGISEAVDAGTYYDFNSGQGTTITFAQVRSSDVDRLGVQFIGVNANQALVNATGETGGDWTEPVGEFASASGTAATVGIQTAAMPTAANIVGGTITISSAGWGVLVFALKPGSVASLMRPIAGVSWLG